MQRRFVFNTAVVFMFLAFLCHAMPCAADCLSPAINLDRAGFAGVFNVLTSNSSNENTQEGIVASLKEKINNSEHKRITFKEFMEIILYDHEFGYYTQEVEIGHFSPEKLKMLRGRSFNTFAENEFVGKAFARLIAMMWDTMDCPDNFTVVEMGAGTGTLAANMLTLLRTKNPALYKALTYVIVEKSDKLREEQKEKLKNFQDKVAWKSSDAMDLSEIRDAVGVFLSNELPDAFPVHRVIKKNGTWQEIYVKVTETGEGITFEDEWGEVSGVELINYINELEKDSTLPEGIEIPINLQMLKWQQGIAAALQRGFVITSDYGDTIDNIIRFIEAKKRNAVWNERIGVSVADIYDYIVKEKIATDITALVDFSALHKNGNMWGLRTSLFRQEGHHQIPAISQEIKDSQHIPFISLLDVVENLLELGEDISVDRYLHLEHKIPKDFFNVMIQDKNIDVKDWQEALNKLFNPEEEAEEVGEVFNQPFFAPTGQHFLIERAI